jgi:hypothetical protein
VRQDRYDRDAGAGLQPSGGPGPDTPPLAPHASAFSAAYVKAPAAPPPIRMWPPWYGLLHRRHGWSWAAVTSFIAFLLAYSACANAQSQGCLLRRGSWT